MPTTPRDGGYSGLTTTLALKIGASFVVVGELVDIEGPDIKVQFRNPNKLSSTTVMKRPTLVDLGKYKFTVNYDPNDTTCHTVIRDRALSPPATADEWKVTYPNPDGLATPPSDDFKGYVGGWKEKGFTEKDTIQGEVEIEVTDAFTPTAGAA